MRARAIFLFAIIVGQGGTMAGDIAPDLAARLKQIDDKDRVRIIIELLDQADLAGIKGNREQVIRLLREVADYSQQRIIARLESGKKRGEVEEYRSYYIFNGLYAECKKVVVLELVDYPEVRKIFVDGVAWTGESDGSQGDGAGEVLRDLSRCSSGYWWNIERVGAASVRDILGIDGQGVIVGVIDEGFSGNHPDLVPRWKSLYGWKDFVFGRANPYDSNNGHGTQVTGIIIAGDNSGSNIGIAPGARFISARAFHNHSGQYSHLLAAMEWMLDPDDDGDPATGDEHVPHVVNNSWGTSTYDTYFRTAVASWVAAGIFPCFISGNSGPSSGSVLAPGSYSESVCGRRTAGRNTI